MQSFKKNSYVIWINRKMFHTFISLNIENISITRYRLNNLMLSMVYMWAVFCSQCYVYGCKFATLLSCMMRAYQVDNGHWGNEFENEFVEQFLIKIAKHISILHKTKSEACMQLHKSFFCIKWANILMTKHFIWHVMQGKQTCII